MVVVTVTYIVMVSWNNGKDLEVKYDTHTVTSLMKLIDVLQ